MGVLRRVFGASRDEIWRQLSERVGGRFVEGSLLKSARVEAVHGEWTVTLDSITVPAGKVMIEYTRMRAPYVNPHGFRFTIYRRGIFTGLGRFFGMQDVEVGDPAFDEAFVVQANDESLVRQLLSAPRLRELLSAQPEVQFGVKDDEGLFGPTFPEGVDELQFTVPGVIKDVERLRLLYELFAETLDELCRMGAAYEGSPNVRL